MGAGPSAPSPEQVQALLTSVDVRCAEAARLIQSADVLLLCTGAGFSADSGLAVYADVAKVKAYAERGLEYHNICEPKWLTKCPPLFWGFWGQCYNDYRNTAPHVGYEMVDRWADRWFRSTPTATALREAVAARMQAKEAELQAKAAAAGVEFQKAEGVEPYTVTELPGAFFAFTSNVDAHHFDWFRACEIRECHGNTELYQCAGIGKKPCEGVWRAPLDFHFQVDKETMLAEDLAEDGAAKAEARGCAPAAELLEAAERAEGGNQPRIGHVRGGGRTTTLRYMPGEPTPAQRACFRGNRVVCPQCGAPGRPAILMFGDSHWNDVESQSERWDAWLESLAALCQERRSAERPLRVVALEIGAGGNVTTVRNTTERNIREFLDDGADAKLVRVNPDLPLGDDEPFAPSGSLENSVVSIMDRGLDSLKRIDMALAAETS